eukprot:COSAG01_NODE_178_length_22933_cov_18.398529_21_plen_106_part_00
MAGRLAGVHTFVKGGLRSHAPLCCAWMEAATVLYLLVQLATPKRAILQLFLLYQGLSLKYNTAAPGTPVKTVWATIDAKISSKLPGALLPAYRTATDFMGKQGRM